jgi:hypothetical protein
MKITICNFCEDQIHDDKGWHSPLKIESRVSIITGKTRHQIDMCAGCLHKIFPTEELGYERRKELVERKLTFPTREVARGIFTSANWVKNLLNKWL